MTAAVLLLAGLQSGCANRAYSDLYIENMAAEIRDLEDQLYEYDHEYRMIEQELATVTSENQRLRSQLDVADSTEADSESTRRPRRLPIDPDPPLSSDDPPAAQNDPQSILDNAGSQPAPNLQQGQDVQPGPADGAPADPAVPNSPFPNQLPAPPSAGGIDDIDADSLIPPAITPGEVVPPTGANNPSPPAGLTAEARSDSLHQSQIEIPAFLASRRTEADQGAGALRLNDSGSDTFGATLAPAIEQVTDTRIVELAFHSSFCRAANFDDEPDDDGLMLLLQPLNERGQMVAIAARLLVVVIDPSTDKKIGRWEYSSQEVEAKLQPIGTQQGIRLTLPWNGADPQADRVIVFAKYTLPNGREVVADAEIFVSIGGEFQTAWAPRSPSAKPATAMNASPHVATGKHPVSQADYRTVQSVETDRYMGSPSRRNDALRKDARVVRPASGTTVVQPAPLPSGPTDSPPNTAWTAR